MGGQRLGNARQSHALVASAAQRDLVWHGRGKAGWPGGAVRGQAGPALLATYEQERREHAKAMIDLSVLLGRILSPTRKSTARAQDLLLRAAATAPGARNWLTEMRFKPRPHYRDGFLVPPASKPRLPGAGSMFIQPVVEVSGKRRVRLDEALGSWFAVVGFECDPLACLDSAALAVVDGLEVRVIKIVESRAGEIHHRKPVTRPGTVVIEDADNELRRWFTARDGNVVVLRPDRYVAALTSQADLGQALMALRARLSPESITAI
jgi:3-(3-hydroxy-phenyl)propionate hydroxylase